VCEGLSSYVAVLALQPPIKDIHFDNRSEKKIFPGMIRADRIREFLGLRRSIVGLLAMVILVGLGERMAERFLPLYLIALGGGATAVGILNGMYNLFGALYSYPGGYASHRLGYKRALFLFNLLAMTGYSVVIIFPGWQAVLIGAVMFISWTAISLPATMDLVASALPQNKRTMGVSLHSLVRRIPMALGPIVGGLLIGQFGEKRGIYLAFVAALILAAVSLVMQQVLIKEHPPSTGNKPGSGTGGFALLKGPLRQLLVSDILIRFCEQIPYAFVVLWCVSINGISALQFGVLTAIEMGTAMIVYVPVAYFADRTTKKPFVATTFVFFSLFPLVLLFSHSFWAMAGAFVLRGLKEFGEPTRKALIMDLAPEGKKASTFGHYYLVRDVIVSIAAFGGAILWDGATAGKILDMIGMRGTWLAGLASIASPETNFLVAFGFGVFGTIYFTLFGKDLGSPHM
jgi:MFS family permease